MDREVKNKLIYGCMGLGGEWNRQAVTKEDEMKAQEVVEKALELGINTFDHANIYTYGKAELVFGKILKERPSLRQALVLQSKAGIRLGEGPKQSNIYQVDYTYIIQEVESILQRLETDYLDIFLLHRPDVLMEAEEIARAFEYLEKQGMVKDFGLSNMSVSQIELIQHYCHKPLVCNQIQLSLGHSLVLEQGVNVNTHKNIPNLGTEGLLTYAQLNNMQIQAWGSLDQGRFTGAQAKGKLKGSDVDTIRLLETLAEKYEVNPSAIALAWLLRLPGDVRPILGTTNLDRIVQCQASLEIQLSRADWYDLWITARGESLP